MVIVSTVTVRLLPELLDPLPLWNSIDARDKISDRQQQKVLRSPGISVDALYRMCGGCH